MKSQLDREIVEKLRESSNLEFAETVNQTVYNLVSAIVEDISKRSPFVKPEMCILQPVNEICTGAFSQLSEYVYFLGVDNINLEANSKRSKNFWKNLWREFKASFRLGRKKYKREKEPSTPILEIDKYSINNFKHDILLRSTQFLSPSSIITEYANCVTFIGNNDFGTNVLIKIYVCCYDHKTNTFKYPLPNKNKFLPLSFGQRFENLSLKGEKHGKLFVDILKVFNSIYSKNYNSLPNQILLESLIWGTPDVLFDKKNFYKTFINVANYIRLASPSSFASICDSSKNIFQEPLIIKATKQVDFGRIVNMLDRFKY